jgi:thiol:disulfide interchange protein
VSFKTSNSFFMKKLILTLLAIGSISVITLADYPKGSPKFSSSYSQVTKKAKESGKPMILVFSASWCPPCQTMKNEVYPSEAVKAYHDQFEWAYLDADDGDNEKLMAKFEVSGIPHVQFLAADGKPMDKVVGGMEPADFAGKLKEVLAAAKK